MLLKTHGSEVKAFLVLQMHLMGMRLPSSDFANDLHMLLDHVSRLLSAPIDLCSHLKLPDLFFAGICLSQAVVQGRWPDCDDVLPQLPYASQAVVKVLREQFRVAGIADLNACTCCSYKNRKFERAV